MNLRILFSLLLSSVNLLILLKVLITRNAFWQIPPRHFHFSMSESQHLEKLVNAVIPLKHDGRALFFLFVLCYQFSYCNSSFLSLCILYSLYFIMLLYSMALDISKNWYLFLAWFVFVNLITTQTGEGNTHQN